MKPKSKEPTATSSPHYTTTELYQILFEQASDGIFIADMRGRYVEVNRYGCEMLGYSREELLTLSIPDLLPAEDLVHNPLRLDDLRAGKTVLTERQMRTKDGRLLPVEINARMLSNDSFLAITRDITQRKQLERQLRESEERFRLLSESSLTGIYLIQQDGSNYIFRYVNPAMSKMFGYAVEELVDRRGPLELVYPEDRPVVAENIRRRIEGEAEEIHYEFRGQRKDGSIVHIEVHGRRIEYDGKTGVLGSLVDITERKQAEQRLTLLNFALDNIHEAAFLIDETAHIYYVNGEAGRALGYTRTELLGLSVADIDPDFPLTRWPDHWSNLKTHHSLMFEGRHKTKEGQIIPVEISANYFEYEGQGYNLALVRNITERKQTEAVLRGSERRLAEAQRIAQIGYWERDFAAGHITLSDEACRIFGLPPHGFPLSLEQWHQRWLELVHPEDRDRTAQAIAEALQDGPPYNLEYRVIRPNGEVRFIHSEAVISRDESGRPRSMLGMMQDITKLRQAQDEIRASEARFRTFVDHATDAFFLHDDRGIILDVNRQACESLGYSREELIGMRPLDFDAGIDLSFLDQHRARLAAGQMTAFDTRHRRKDGSVFPVEVRTRPFWQGERRFGVSLARDITERKRAEAALHRLNRELHALSKCNETLLRAVDEQTLLYDICRIICDEAGYRMAWVGYAEQDEAQTVRPVAWAGVEEEYLTTANITWADRERGRGPTGTAIRSGESACIQDFTTESQAIPWHEMAMQRGYHSNIALPLKDESAHTFGALTIYSTEPNVFTPDEIRLLNELAGNLAFGITTMRIRAERKKAELQVQASEQLFRAMVENSPDFIARYDRKFRRVYVNPAIQKLFGKTAEGVLNTTPVDESPIYAPQIYIEQLQRVIETATECVVELLFRTAQGEMHWGHIRFTPEFGPDGQVVSVLAIGRDIHEIKQAEVERQAHLHFLASIDQINRAIQGTNNLEQMMCDVLDALLDIFECDRAWLVYPCDPGAATWQTPMERTRPEYPGVLPVGVELPLDPVGAAVFQILRDTPGPVIFGPESQHQVPEVLAQVFKVQSFIAAAIYPKVEKPWSFGLHQCSYARVWTPEDQRLFQESANRLADALTSLLAYYNLQESEKRYRALYHANPIMFFTLDTEGIIVSLNDFGADQLGYTKDELEGQPVLQICYAEDRTCLGEQLAICLQNPWQVYHWQFRKIRKDGSVMWVEEFVRTVDGPNGQLFALVVCHDITERKQTEHALREKTEELDRFFTVALDLLCIADLSGYFRRLNPQWEVVLGYSLPELEGRRFFDFVHPDDQASTLTVLSELGAQKTVLDFVNRYRCQDGSYRWIEWRAYPAGNLIYAAARDITERKRVEEALRESEFFLRKSQAVARLGSYYLDARTGHWISSPTLDEIFGIDAHFPKDIESWLGLVHPEHKEEMLQYLDQHVLAGHNRFDKEYLIIRYNDQQERWMHGLGELEFDERGNAIKMIGTIQDITERKEAEKALQLTRFTMESVADAVYWINSETRIIEVNKAACDMLGYTHDELCRLSISDIDPVFSIAQWPQVWELIQTMGRNTIESMHRTKTGQLIPVEIIANFIKFGDQELDCAIVRDVTERKQAEAQLRTSQARYRALVESQLDLISRYLPDTTLTFVNDAYCQFYGKQREELIGLSSLTMVAPEFHEMVVKDIESLLKEPRSVAGEYLNYTWDGKARWIHWIMQSIIDENGRVIELQAVGRDITPLKQAEEEIRQLNQELEQRVAKRTAQLEAVNKELEAFAYSVSHDLRAPLRHINGFLEMLEPRIAASLDERSRHYMTTIADSAKRMGQLIDDLLSFSRLGRSEMSQRPVNLAELVQEVIRQLEPEIQGRMICWHLANLPVVKGDRAMLRIVLDNLIANAIKFTRGRGQAEIEIGCEPGEGSETIFFVRDNGAGFDMAYADKLFGVFQRLHRVDEFEGTGIGLANVRRIIQRHGGRTWAEGQVNQGATFYFSLPQTENTS